MMKKNVILDKIGRLDKVLSEKLDDYSRTQIVKLIESAAVRESISGKVLTKSYKVETKMEVIVDFNCVKSEEQTIEAKNIPLDIIFEDEFLIVLNKPKGMVVHPGAGLEQDTLVHALKYHCGNNLSDINPERAGIVHRLDKDTAGLMLAAKNNKVHQLLSKMFSEHSIERHYRAICYGLFRERAGEINGPIARDPANRMRMAILPFGREALTYFKVIDEYRRFSLLDLRLKTGRTHQIRVHLEAINHPILGDEVYTSNSYQRLCLDFLKGQCLYSANVRFIHPITGEELYFEIDEPEFFSECKKYLALNNM